MTFVIKVCGFSSLSRSGAPKFVSAFSDCIGCRLQVECQLSNNPTLFWEWNGQLLGSKVGKELPAILVKRNLYISIFITKHISFGRNQRVHNQYKWLAVHPTIAMKWSGEIVEWLLCSGQSTLCFIWYLLFFAFFPCVEISQWAFVYDVAVTIKKDSCCESIEAKLKAVGG